VAILERRAEDAKSQAEDDEAEFNGALGALATSEEQKNVYLTVWTEPEDRLRAFLALAIAISLLGAAIIGLIYAERRRACENQAIIDGADAPSRMELAPLWERNEKRLQQYHKLVQNYSTSTRQVTLATILGEFVFLVLIGSGFLLLSDTDTAVAAAIVTAVFAGVTGYVANVVLRNADTSSREVREFFLHPIAVERHLSAERILQGMDPAEQGAARLILVESLANQPGERGAPQGEWVRDSSQPAAQAGQ
jgi:hypothetical protein